MLLSDGIRLFCLNRSYADTCTVLARKKTLICKLVKKNKKITKGDGLILKIKSDLN